MSNAVPAAVMFDDTDMLPPPPPLTREDTMDTGLKQCRVCKEFTLLKSDPVWKEVCSLCYTSSDKRACVSCSLLVIPNYEPAWRTLCGPCFKDDSLYRCCENCGAKSIKPGTKAYIKNCGDCWKKDRAQTHVLCPSCGDTDKRLKMKKGQKMCRECSISKTKSSK